MNAMRLRKRKELIAKKILEYYYYVYTQFLSVQIERNFFLKRQLFGTKLDFN